MSNFDENNNAGLNNNENPTQNGMGQAPTPPEEYSYTNYSVSRVPEERSKASKKKDGKGRRVLGLSLIMIGCIVISSVATAFMMQKLWENGVIFGSSERPSIHHGIGEETSSSDVGGADGPVTITKNPGDKVDLVEGAIGDENMSVAQVAALVADSVVEITTSSVQYDIFYGQQIVSGAGSGVVIGRSEDNKKEYYIVTNHHVIENAESIYVSLRDGSEYVATLIGSDAVSDLAILKIESSEGLTVAMLGCSDSLVVGDEIVVVGNPLGKLGGTVTDGIISALERKVKIDGLEMTLLQHNAAISPGNSGGGIFDMSGYLIGVINAKSNVSSAEGIGFAIPIDYAYGVISDILNYGYVTGRPALPFETQEYISSSMFGSTSTYVVVTSVSDEYDIQYNDIVYSIGETRVADVNSMISILSGYKVGDTVTVTVARTSGREVGLYSCEVTLVEYTVGANNS